MVLSERPPGGLYLDLHSAEECGGIGGEVGGVGVFFVCVFVDFNCYIVGGGVGRWRRGIDYFFVRL